MSTQTEKTYQTALKRVSQNVFDGKKMTSTILSNAENINKIFNWMDKENIPLNSQKTILSAIHSITEEYTTLPKKVMAMLSKRFNATKTAIKKELNEELNNPKEKYAEKIINPDTLNELKEKLKAELKDIYQPTKDVRYLIISLYTGISAPCRPQDFYNSIVTTKERIDADPHKDEKNYLLMDEGILIINKGKTKNSRRTIPIPEDVLDDIIEFHRKSKSKWLIPATQDNSEHMEQSAFTKLMQRTFKQHYGKNISASMLRKIHISKIYKEIDKEFPEFDSILKKLKEKAAAMGHALTTQEIYARLKNIV